MNPILIDSLQEPSSYHSADLERKDPGEAPKSHRREVSLSTGEKFVLHALLVDSTNDKLANNPTVGQKSCPQTNASRQLNDDVLFTVPDVQLNGKELLKRKCNPFINSLWRAYEDGVQPKALVMRSSIHGVASMGSPEDNEDDDIPSDEEVRNDPNDDSATASSWDDEDYIRDYSAWEILKDEYAKDFGYDYGETQHVANKLNEGVVNHNVFRIVGTSADDVSAQPHVLSPPLMDALMNHLPQNLVGENYWLKFSLVRDGASLATLQTYCRATPNTILAIETDKGDVFGSFTLDTWRNHYGFYGPGPKTFLWKLKQSRRTKQVCLFDQAALESQVDVYPFQGDADGLVQLCHHDALAVGGDDDIPTLDDLDDLHSAVKAADKVGFAIALEGDLMIGSTSPSSSFGSPSLCGSHDHSDSFQVANLEVWTLTPCVTVSAAEKLELSKYLIGASTRGTERSEASTSSRSFSGQDFDQEKFYRRVGHDAESEVRRQQWQYTNMMHGTGTKGMAASPRFM